MTSAVLIYHEVVRERTNKLAKVIGIQYWPTVFLNSSLDAVWTVFEGLYRYGFYKRISTRNEFLGYHKWLNEYINKVWPSSDPSNDRPRDVCLTQLAMYAADIWYPEWDYNDFTSEELEKEALRLQSLLNSVNNIGNVLTAGGTVTTVGGAVVYYAGAATVAAGIGVVGSVASIAGGLVLWQMYCIQRHFEAIDEILERRAKNNENGYNMSRYNEFSTRVRKVK